MVEKEWENYKRSNAQALDGLLVEDDPLENGSNWDFLLDLRGDT